MTNAIRLIFFIIAEKCMKIQVNAKGIKTEPIETRQGDIGDDEEEEDKNMEEKLIIQA